MAGSDTKAEKNALLDKIGEIEKKHKGRKIIKKPPMVTQVPAEPLPAEETHNKGYFSCDILNCSIKDDMASMEAPLFSLSTREDTREWKWISEDGARSVSVVAVAQWGRATQFDKDVLLFCMSQLTAALNADREISKIIRFTAYDLLKATGRNTSGRDYDNLKNSLNRLSGTRITTEIKTGGLRVAEGFGMIDSWKVVEESENNNRMVALEVKLSDWTFNSVRANEVLTLHPNYFKLRKPLERRLYEIARKHVGYQKSFKIGLEVLMKKAGVMDTKSHFRTAIRNVIKNGKIPDYQFALDEDIVSIFHR